MALDVLEAVVAQDGVDSAAFRAQGVDLDLIVKLLQRDDPMRRSYLQRRWQRPHSPVHPTCRSAVWNARLALIALSRR